MKGRTNATPHRPGTPRPGIPPRLAVLLVCLLAPLLTSCSELQGAAKTQQALTAAGFASVNVNVHRDLGSGQTSVSVTYVPGTTDAAAIQAQRDKAAEIVWKTARSSSRRSPSPPPRSARSGSALGEPTRARSWRAGSARVPPGSMSSQGGGPPTTVIVIGVAVLVVLLLAGGILLWVLLAAARRRNRAAAQQRPGKHSPFPELRHQLHGCPFRASWVNMPRLL